MTTDTIALLVIAVINAIVAYVAWRTKIAAERTETNTNSMREQLVERTAEASHAEGREEMRVEAADTAATLAKGQKQGRTKK